MDKVLSALCLILLAIGAFADSDVTGAIAGTQERVVMSVANSSGLFDNSSNCMVKILYGITLSLDWTNLTNANYGQYYFDWSVPQDIGVYNFVFNCTTPGGENYTAAGSVNVVKRNFEKAVATGVSKYSAQYSEDRYDTAWWQSEWIQPLTFMVIASLILGGAYLLFR